MRNNVVKKVLAATLACMMTFSMTTVAQAKGDKKSDKEITIGVTSFADTLEPTEQYFSWVVSRYAIGECLTKFDENGEIVPCLAEEWENSDDGKTWTFKIREGVKFSNGDDMTPEMVKASIERTAEKSDRVPEFFDLDSLEVDGQNLIFHLNRANANMAGSLADPLFLIVDTNVDDSTFAMEGPICTGPYKVESFSPTDSCVVTKNENYWDGEPKLDELTIRTITDGNTLANALQSGEVQAAYGMAYESYPTFENDNFQFSQISTSRCFFGKMNFDEASVCSDAAVRKAIAMGIDKESFVTTLLEGNGYPANGVFPEGSAFGGDKVTTESYDPEGAKKVLEEAGWKDSDGDGIREKDGKKLVVKWLTYPSRQELPLLAESAQATLKDIGIEVDINCTADNNSILEDPTAWDVYAMANVQAPTGDPEYWFTVFATSDATKNSGKYSSAKLDELEAQLSKEFDEDKRAELAVQMQQTILDDNAFVFCSFLKMSMISRSNVTGYESHACDYYQVTADLDIN